MSDDGSDASKNDAGTRGTDQPEPDARSQAGMSPPSAMKKWGPLAIFGVTQFLMLLDTSVMNVAISQLVEDFDTDVTSIQAAITFYALVMAALMLTGAKLADVLGRRRAMVIGMLIYGAGSALTAVSWSVGVLTFGWSVLEGIGAALVLPAMWALVPAIYRGRDRATAFGLLGGVAGAAVAVGPILGGYFTTELSWRYVFVGEVILALLIVVGLYVYVKENRPDEAPAIDWAGSVLSAVGMTLVVFGVLQASDWGLITPRNSPVEILGLSLTPFLILAGLLTFSLFVRWERWRSQRGEATLVRLTMFENVPFRSGLVMLVMQSVILAGVFFALPLFLQVVLGLNALDTGVRLLPVSLTLFVVSVFGSQFLLRFSPKRVVQVGLLVILTAIVVVLGTIKPDVDGSDFALAMALFGIGIGMLSAVLGNLIMSTVNSNERNDASGLVNAGGQLGQSLGTAVIGTVVVATLTSVFIGGVAADDRVPAEVAEAIEVQAQAGLNFVSDEDLDGYLTDAGLETSLTDPVLTSYRQAQLDALRYAMFAAATLVLISMFLARNIPQTLIAELAQKQQDAEDQPAQGPR